jgi:hypothetical protein
MKLKLVLLLTLVLISYTWCAFGSQPLEKSTPTSVPSLTQQRLYPVADGEVFAFSNLNWNWANFGMCYGMQAGWYPVAGERRAYLKFDVPADLGVDRAVLKLHQYHKEGPVHTLGVYRVTGPWDEGTGTYHAGVVEETAAPGELCWMQQPSFDPVSIATFTSATAVPAWVEVDITSLVQQWQAGTPNYGLVIKTTNEHPTASDPMAKSGFYTKEHTQANWPVLELSVSGSGTSYPEATLTHSGFDFSEGTTGEYSIRDGEVIYWQPGNAGTHPDYPDYSEYLWWRNTHLDDVNSESQTKDMGAVDISMVRTVPAEWDKSPLIQPLLVGHTVVAKCYDGYVKFQVISVDSVDESARVKYSYSVDTSFDDATS